MLYSDNLFDRLEIYKLVVEKKLNSAFSSDYYLIKDPTRNHWLFSYKDLLGKISHHPIRSFLIGKNHIYKNGGTIMASSLESLIDFLTKGLVQVQGIEKKTA